DHGQDDEPMLGVERPERGDSVERNRPPAAAGLLCGLVNPCGNHGPPADQRPTGARDEKDRATPDARRPPVAATEAVGEGERGRARQREGNDRLSRERRECEEQPRCYEPPCTSLVE